MEMGHLLESILKWFLDWYWFPSRFKKSYLVIPTWKRGAVCLNPVSIRQFSANHLHLVIPMWKREATCFEPSHGNSDSPIPFGDSLSHFPQMGKYIGFLA
jgi:hypothetical protein